MPYLATAIGQTNSSAPATTTTYDALGRVYQVIDGGGGVATYTYNSGATGSDVLVVATPAPANENPKQKQYEYDALGRLASVCEITSATGSGSCGQANPATGFLTNYTYNTLGKLTGVSQNAKSTNPQTRSFYYDMLGRMTSEGNPETNAILYAYDSDTNGPCASVANPKGSLVKRTDAMGNVTCYSYDLLHRATSVTYPSIGPYAAVTPTKCFVYDSASFNGQAMSYAAGRLAEAYTTSSASCPSSSRITDEYFGYSQRGELSDVYETTPNSKGTYHTNATYWPNGALQTLSGVPQHSGTWSFGVDPEARPKTAIDGTTSTTLVSNTTYYLLNQVDAVTLGPGDSDTYAYDSAGRMNSYQFSVEVAGNTKLVTGTPYWNPNGTLGTLTIADPLDSTDAEQCAYAYDDLVRISSVNCGPTSPNGSTWTQSFAYDPFGNISKSGTSSFLPTYTGTGTTPTNQFYQIPGGPTGTSHYYDLNGNLTSDLTNTYTWDAEGKAITINGIGLTYDALGRMVEQNSSGAYTQILYSPIGKLGLMSKQVAVNVFMPLPGGEQATYTNGTIRFRHYDWQGSARLESNTAQQEYGDIAYAPFGESYAISKNPYPSFTGQQQDTSSGTTGVYDFLFREYSAGEGRWISPDPAGMGAVDPSNPQSWNRYAYVVNNPLALVDQLGLQQGQGGDCHYGSGGEWICNPHNISAISTQTMTVTVTSYVWSPPVLVDDIFHNIWYGDGLDSSLDSSPATLTLSGGGWTAVSSLVTVGLGSVSGGGAANNGPPATISAGPPDAKKNYCLHQSNMAGLEAVLPGGHVLLGNDYSPSAVLGSVAEVSSHIGPEVLAGSTALKYSIRSSTGIPMSVAENIFKGLGYFALAVTGYSALSASQHEYQACMAW
jgi:RHS repeat-associated protein